MAPAQIKVEKLDKPHRDGDWHDPILKWAVIGPGTEEQHFATKAAATRYKRLRANSESFWEATRRYTILI